MSNTANHLPTPYEVAGNFIRTARGARADGALDGQLVAELDHRDPKHQATADFVVRACNTHEQMVTALRGGRVAIDVLMAQLIEADPSFAPTRSAAWPSLIAITHALTAAEA